MSRPPAQRHARPREEGRRAANASTPPPARQRRLPPADTASTGTAGDKPIRSVGPTFIPARN